MEIFAADVAVGEVIDGFIVDHVTRHPSGGMAFFSGGRLIQVNRPTDIVMVEVF